MASFNSWDKEHVQCKPCKVCTYALSHDQLLHQAIYICSTCDPSSSYCCCAGCAEICHAGHNVSFLAFGRAYCDCGAAGCSLKLTSMPTAEYMVKSGTSPQFSVDMSICIPPFRAYTFLDKNMLGSDLKANAIQLVESSKDTFWMDYTATPRCFLELYAHEILKQHMETLVSLGVDRGVIGAEWWVQVKTLDEDNSDSMTIDLHYDKDEEVAEVFSVGLFPAISTVTYLTQRSSRSPPTVVFPVGADAVVGNPIPRCYVSWPVLGKHVAFDGRFLHGAPAHKALCALTMPADVNLPHTDALRHESGPRVTFLVNIWCGHRPVNVIPLPAQFLSVVGGHLFNPSDQSPQLVPMDGKSIEIHVSESDIPIDDSAEDEIAVSSGSEPGSWIDLPFISEDSVWGKDEDEAGLRLVMWMPTEKISQAHQERSRDEDCSCIAIIYEDDAAAAFLEYEEDEDDLPQNMDEMNLA
eukprot:gene188-323_t